jgi:hypothetical protein
VHLVAKCEAQFALLLVAPLAVVEDAADGRVCVGRDLDEIEFAPVGVRARLLRAHHSELTSILGKQPHGLVADLFVDPGGDAPVLGDGAALACFSQAESFLERKRERSGAPFGKDDCLSTRAVRARPGRTGGLLHELCDPSRPSFRS